MRPSVIYTVLCQCDRGSIPLLITSDRRDAMTEAESVGPREVSHFADVMRADVSGIANIVVVASRRGRPVSCVHVSEIYLSENE